MPLTREPDTEPIPGYRLIEFLGRGGFGEVWKCEAPGGVFKAIKFVHDNSQSLGTEPQQADQEWQALQLVKTIRHPFLLSIDRLELVEGELVVVMELADSSLAEAFRDCREAGLPGIPRADLLAYLREAAEALDVINLQHRLQHLDVKPGNLFLVHRHVKVGDFGLLNRLGDGTSLPPGAALGGLTPLYCAPETLTGAVSGRSDQYSLAVVYQELLTGQPPFAGRNARELMLRRATDDPDLTPLPAAERPVLQRALARDPEARYPSCTEFVRALADDAGGSPRAREERPATQPVPSSPAPGDRRQLPAGSRPDFAGHRLAEWVGRGPLCETWKVQGPGGSTRLLKFYTGLTNGTEAAESAALRFLTGAAHRHLLPAEVLKDEGGRIGLISDPRGGMLAERLEHERALGQPGVPRRELLDSLYGVADALDALAEEHHLQHLWLSPQTLVIDRKRLLIADLGLAELLWLPAGQPVGRLNGRYAAPELCAGRLSPACDQYSLAVIFQEMLTGTSPIRGRNARGKAELNLDLLPAPDREPIARALDPDPNRRFATCSELIEALDRPVRIPAECVPERPVPVLVEPRAPVVLAPVISVQGNSLAPAPAEPLPPPQVVIEQLLQRAAGGFQLRRTEVMSYFLQPGKLLKHSYGTLLHVNELPRALEAFRDQWEADLACKDLTEFWLEVPISQSLWRRCLGRRPTIVIQVCVGSHQLARMTAVRVAMQPAGCGPEQAVCALEQQGPLLLQGLRTALGALPERRAQGRLPFEHPLGVFPVFDAQRLGDAFLCQGKDVLASGIGLIAPSLPSTEHVYLQPLFNPQLSALALLGRVVRTQQLADGRYMVGVTFAQV